MKTRRVSVTSTPMPAPRKNGRARGRLRDFALFVERQNPELLASQAENVDLTLRTCAAIQSWFQRYVAALKARVVH